MAERRMFAKSVVLSDAFLALPHAVRCLYFTLGMVADDDGFVSAPLSVLRQVLATEKDLEALIAAGYVIRFESGPLALIHWRVNNFIRTDRYTPTNCADEKRLIGIDAQKRYVLLSEREDLMQCAIPLEDSPQPRTSVAPTLEAVQSYCRDRGYPFADRFHAHYTAQNWRTPAGASFDWRAKADEWAARERDLQEAKRQEQPQRMSFDANEAWEKAVRKSYGDM